MTSPLAHSGAPDAALRRARVALFALLLGALGISFAPIFVRLSEVGPSATAFWRLAFALPVLWLWMQVEPRATATTRRPSSRSDYWRLSLAGLFFAGDLAVWHWSIKLTSVANATLLANFAPIVVTLTSWLLFGQRFSLTFITGLALAMGGAIVLMGGSFSLGAGNLLGDLLGLGTSFFYGFYLMTVGRLRQEFSTATIMTWSGVVTAVALVPIALLSGESLVATSAYGWFVLIGLGLVSHAGGQSLIAYALAHLPPAFSSVSLLLQPAAAAVLAWLLFAEPLGPRQLLGGAVILAGIFLARKGSSTRR